MKSNNMSIKTTLKIDNVPYQGNPALLAQRWIA
jgi:hypothetical protein